MPFHTLFFNNLVTSFFKKRLCGNGSVCNYFTAYALLKFIADCRSNAPALIICVNIQAVEISRLIYIAEPYNYSVINGYNAVMFQQRLVPGFKVYVPGCPRIELLIVVIGCVDSVHSVVEQLGKFAAVRLFISS